jgi:hypothetical protein
MRVSVLAREQDDAGHRMRIAFRRDAEVVEKVVKLGDDRKLNGYRLMLRAQEADRDLAYKLHGEAWRHHCEYRGKFYDGLPREQFDELLKALDP